ncbi:hypothetical protein ACFYTG_35820 [Streptomyces mirabilis]|uniref:hypothetical protein n=1 Tax=Streptomyces mirabilis TaxID=68239 RepID=UPI0036CE3BF2
MTDLTRQPAHVQLRALEHREISSRARVMTALRVLASIRLVVPVATAHQGLPMGIQLIGRPYADRDLLAVADQLASLLHAFEQ